MTTWIPTGGPDSAAVPVVTTLTRRSSAHADAGRRDAPAGANVLDEVVRTHLPGLVRYATALTGDGHTAADLVQEVLLRAHVRWHRIALMERPDLYLRRMVTNEHLSWRRRWHVRTIHPAADDVLAAHAPHQGDHADDTVHDDVMWAHLAALPPRQRAVLVLRYYEGLADPEIASVLETSSATVRSHASRALATLRRTDLTTAPETR
ncbi:SigE family RNA polymerase sigma factor [Cellulomonas wangsupingiae]|uniref:SigE family RNA polymerase sigma factor n=1 Tax=Cellulomonas wangsupingiae TaxID=2968085 RepID=A0ABY5K2N8_9CELL|nr:SigE family RNA polymerase sigma factor [Cellulomonas wangsupingiae]MCC2336401.1 SigE family RNA polymerase sigma factor [Cellulomonas wangsupingiae]MCM0640908.1 SigE family RNA polymerase sigma factor [Cellulomonas wangsupingiae]UUI64714.1 SigE family RNA polymerase sigma factor [Cellulomonas wangsupingiae]